MTKNKRVSEIFSYLKENRKVLNQSDFSKLLGKERSYISELLNGKREVSEQFVGTLCDLFTDINPKWIIDGVGEMINNNVNQKNINGDNINENHVTIHKTETDKFLDVIKKSQEQIDKSQEHIDKMLSIISSQQHTISVLASKENSASAKAEAVCHSDLLK